MALLRYADVTESQSLLLQSCSKCCTIWLLAAKTSLRLVTALSLT